MTSEMRQGRALPRKALSIMQPEVGDAFGNWLAGFIDGEGCFFFHSRRKQFSPPQFQLKLRDDDRAILEECVSRTGLGRIITTDRRGRSNPQIKWLISRCSDCRCLVEIIDRYPLRAKKKRDFEIWREAVLLWDKQTKIGIAGGGTQKFAETDRINELHVQLKEGRQYART